MTEVTVGTIDDIPVGEGRAFAVDGEQVAVFRLRDGTLRALGAVCPHKGGPLADGLADDGVVVCPLHGYTYDLCTGAETTGTDMSVSVYHATADPDGTLRVSVASRTGPAAG
ncbi:Rieske (2Fe-2S) protein [Mycobacterium gordonae]|uniref:(2Fe-2S)-binding protein n=1 Tax=Mycobacterium gordonae TaxID=1778 RepID=A0A1X1X4K1_MYCGO|nr:Rieske 2Fe-2S domain-containing protein [Mycobacterium gordonae]MCV7009471.1 Rieske 2Fe-2S domain-containing protein [Mycobacterium gordonae]ORV93795.1 (2Fe-2S)-binding protein [Mycobacterium gordonae]